MKQANFFYMNDFFNYELTLNFIKETNLYLTNQFFQSK